MRINIPKSIKCVYPHINNGCKPLFKELVTVIVKNYTAGRQVLAEESRLGGRDKYILIDISLLSCSSGGFFKSTTSPGRGR